MNKLLNFYGRFAPSFTAAGFIARGLPLRPIGRAFSGQTWLVTGATGGIGKSIAIGAAKRGATVYVVGRNGEALAALARDHGIKPLQFDLDKVGDNVRLAEEVAAGVGKLDVLVNNVGRLEHVYKTSPDGFESTYALNLLGHYALTERLIARGALKDGLVINMASGGLYNSALSLRRLEQTPERYSGVMAYAAHKRAQIALSDKWTAQGVRSYTMHPGWVATDGVRTALPDLNKHLGWILRSGAQGADTALWLAARRPAPQAGALWFDRAPRSAHAYPHSQTPEVEPAAIFAKLEADVAKAGGV
ncbi:SDR family NAD(P)-dependent oxidoreductase [Phenylobacterium sp.]|jgi:NAD(P)-dependent dehydrogenase (short-subunit alcohol dehydrogenase family)|uniref:SDR family NAD(P)-dependent oxidoreductase n=1 Tax=Phenylobacterium sp. TaxID=1871053 RepID=UPI0035AEA645